MLIYHSRILLPQTQGQRIFCHAGKRHHGNDNINSAHIRSRSRNLSLQIIQRFLPEADGQFDSGQEVQISHRFLQADLLEL